MNKISYEIYKAFAQTKPSEFDSFHRDWITDHATIEDVVEIQSPPKRRRTVKPKVVVSEPTIVVEATPELPYVDSKEEPTEE